MRVLFDYQIFAQQRYGGISRYIVRLAEGLRLVGCDARISAPVHSNEHLRLYSGDRGLRVDFQSWISSRKRISTSLNELLTASVVRGMGPDVIHETYYSSRGVVSGWKGARVVTVHDMIHEKFPECFAGSDKTAEIKRLAVNRADHIIAVSQSTKADLCEILGVPEGRVTVVHHGFDRMPVPASHSVQVSAAKPYILFVGGRAGYKNFATTLSALASRAGLKSDFDFVAFGGGEFDASERTLINSLGFSISQVRQVSGDDSVLGSLYCGAAALVYSSKYEGFGLPPLEAMALNCPVVASRSSSIPEVVGDAAEYCDPDDVESIASAIEAVVYDSVRSEELIVRGRARVGKFSWANCAERSLAVYSAI